MEYGKAIQLKESQTNVSLEIHYINIMFIFSKRVEKWNHLLIRIAFMIHPRKGHLFCKDNKAFNKENVGHFQELFHRGLLMCLFYC